MGENLATTIACDGSVRLTDWTLLRAHGADAAAFLQGQLTQDVVGLHTGEARLAGYCSAKGRLLASFIVWRMGADEFGLLCSADLAAAVRKRLSMYVLRARCRVDDASGEWSVFGLAGAAAQRLTDGARPWSARQQGAQWLIALPAAEQASRALTVQLAIAPAPSLPALDPRAWS
ncbi:MAG TPA: folate-binding protein, partial [Burkholderiaceae bacterium]|nr:folate-binding protein [Burkholderiaceae bacterium]